MKNFIKNNWFKIIAIFLLFWALDKHTYSYFQFLRWFITGSAVYIAYRAYETGRKKWFVAFTIIAILFNPFIPFYLSKDLWQTIDIIVGIIFLVEIFKQISKDNESAESIILQSILDTFPFPEKNQPIWSRREGKNKYHIAVIGKDEPQEKEESGLDLIVEIGEMLKCAGIKFRSCQRKTYNSKIPAVIFKRMDRIIVEIDEKDIGRISEDDKKIISYYHKIDTINCFELIKNMYTKRSSLNIKDLWNIYDAEDDMGKKIEIRKLIDQEIRFD